jgi:hypothetical protein
MGKNIQNAQNIQRTLKLNSKKTAQFSNGPETRQSAAAASCCGSAFTTSVPSLLSDVRTGTRFFELN